MNKCCGFVLVFLVGIVAGCSEEGPQRFKLSGEAKFEGNPIVYGDIVLTPDGSKGNSGPQGFAQIRDGKYDTSGSEGKGFAGGPTIIRVTGLTGQGGKVVCEYEMSVDLPRQDGTHNINVPKEGAAKPGGATKSKSEI